MKRTFGRSGTPGTPGVSGWWFSFGWVALLSVAVVGASGCTAWRLKQAAELAAQSEPYQQRGVPWDGQRGERPSAVSGPRLLVVGDSTAVGTGASSAEASVAGLIGRDHPGLSVINRARDGARFADIARQLQGADDFDVVLVLGGGNDVIRLTGTEQLTRDVTCTLSAARRLAPVVLVLPAGNVGNAPFFFPPWSWWMTQRSRELHAITRTVAAQTGAVYVNVFAERAEDPFAQQPQRYHATDGLHPSDAGYALWYAELKRQTNLAQQLSALTGQAVSAEAKPWRYVDAGRGASVQCWLVRGLTGTCVEQ